MMKKIILLMFILIMVVTVVSCGGNNDLEIVGIVIETNESGGFLIDVLDGYAEDKMQVHVDNKVKFEEGVAATDIVPGVVIGITIKNEVMESYPVQANATKILWTEDVVSGTILSVGEEAALLNIEEGYDTGMMQLWFEDETIFYRDIPKLMEKQKKISFTMKDEVLETEPIQGFAIRIISYE
jgi:hypothetical protein